MLLDEIIKKIVKFKVLTALTEIEGCSAMIMGAASMSVKLVCLYQTTWCNIFKDSNLY